MADTNHFGLAVGRFFFFFLKNGFRGGRAWVILVENETYIIFFFFLPSLKIRVYGPCSVEYLLVEDWVYWYVYCKHSEFGAH